MTFHKELQTLKEFHCDERCVLSVYLNTNPADPEQQKSAWKIHLKTGLKRIDEYITASNDEKEMKAFKELKKKVVDEIEKNQNDLHKGVVIFASEDLWHVYYVQVAVKTSFHWEDRPMLEELEYMYKAYPEAGIVLPSFGEVRILDTAMGFLNDEIIYEFDPNIQGWGVNKVDTDEHQAIGSTKIDELEPRLKENLNRFFKEMGGILERLKKERGWKEIHVTGETEMANAFAEIMREKPASCIYKNLNNSKASIIMHEVFEK